MSTATQYTATIQRFDGKRVVGLRYVAGGGNFDFPGLWDRFIKRIGEIRTPEKPECFGLCRCIPGAKDGTWEYIAAVETAGNAPAPEGMMAVDLPAGEYATFEVKSLAEVKDAWAAACPAAAAIPGAQMYCTPDGCACMSHPSFELYPADFPQTNRLFIYIPIRRA